jgi:hypothetical protein
VPRIDWEEFVRSRQQSDEEGQREAESDDLNESGRDAPAAESAGEDDSSAMENGSECEEEGCWNSAVDLDMG